MSKVGASTPTAASKRAKTGGRAAGTPNRATKEFRDTIGKLLDANASNVGKWLKLVAEGNPGNEIDGIPAVQGDPAKALDLLAKLAEFAAPKLGRVEVTGKDGGPVQYSRVERTIVDPTAPQP